MVSRDFAIPSTEEISKSSKGVPNMRKQSICLPGFEQYDRVRQEHPSNMISGFFLAYGWHDRHQRHMSDIRHTRPVEPTFY